MFPLRDSQPSHRFPFVTILLILANVAVFVWELSMTDDALEKFVMAWGMIPAQLPASVEGDLHPLMLGDGLLRFFTCMFIHGGWAHIIGNLWVLWIFGDNVEDRMGKLRFLVFYVTCGLAAGIAQFAVMPHSAIPTIGASGAIAGVLGAYLFLYPRARVLCLFPVFILPLFIEVPAVIFLAIWFVIQVISGQSLLEAGEAGGVAWWAHVGGFVFGMLTHRFFLRRRRQSS